MKAILGLTAAVVLSAGAAQAATINPADILVADASTDLTRGATESSNVQVYAEQIGVTVAGGAVTVDYLAASLAPNAVTSGVSSFSSGASLAAGTYNSFLVHYDPTSAGSIANVSVDFGQTIVGLILSNTGGGTTLLNTSDAIFGSAGAYDTHLGRRTENSDTFSVSGTILNLVGLTTNAVHVDNIRVLTQPAVAPVPVPASLPLLLAGLGGFAALRRRKG